MSQTTLKFGLREAVTAAISSDTNITVGEHIRAMLEKTTDTNLRSEVTDALEIPSATIEIRSGHKVEVVNRDTPMREMLTTGADPLVVTVSVPHVGG